MRPIFLSVTTRRKRMLAAAASFAVAVLLQCAAISMVAFAVIQFIHWSAN